MKKLYQSISSIAFFLLIFINFNFQTSALNNCTFTNQSCDFGDISSTSSQTAVDPDTGFPPSNNCFNTKETQTIGTKRIFCIPPSTGDTSWGVRLACDLSGATQVGLKYENILTRSGKFPDYTFRLVQANTSYYCAKCPLGTDSINCPVPHTLSGGGGNTGGSPTGEECLMEQNLLTDARGNECIFGTGNSTCYIKNAQFSKIFGAVSRNFFCNGNSKQVNCPTNINSYQEVFTNSDAKIIKPGSGCVLGTDYSPPITGISACNLSHQNWLMYKLDAPPYLVAYTPAQENEFKLRYVECSKQRKTEQECLNEAFGGSGVEKAKIGRCICEVPFNLSCFTGVLCTPVCSVRATTFTAIQVSKSVKSNSPLLLVKILANTLFYIAIFLFSLNMIYQGYKYVKSSGEEEKLKEAKEGLTSNIMGLVFVLLIGGLLSYIIGILVNAGL